MKLSFNKENSEKKNTKKLSITMRSFVDSEIDYDIIKCNDLNTPYKNKNKHPFNDTILDEKYL